MCRGQRTAGGGQTPPVGCRPGQIRGPPRKSAQDLESELVFIYRLPRNWCLLRMFIGILFWFGLK